MKAQHKLALRRNDKALNEANEKIVQAARAVNALVSHALELAAASQLVVNRWEKGDLASAVNHLESLIDPVRACSIRVERLMKRFNLQVMTEDQQEKQVKGTK